MYYLDLANLVTHVYTHKHKHTLTKPHIHMNVYKPYSDKRVKHSIIFDLVNFAGRVHGAPEPRAHPGNVPELTVQ